MNDMTKRVEARQAREAAGLAVLEQAAAMLQRHAKRVNYESKLTGRIAGERLARDAEVWEQAAEKLREMQA